MGGSCHAPPIGTRTHERGEPMIIPFLQAAVPALRPDAVLAMVLLDVALILVAARLVGTASVRLGQPRVVGEIIAGVLLGPTLLGPELMSWHSAPGWLQCDISTPNRSLQSVSECFFPAQARSMLRVLGLLALTFFMFLVGLELDFSSLRGRLRGIIVVALAVVAVPVGLGFAIAPTLYNADFAANFGKPNAPSELAFTLFLGAMLAVTAFPVMARILQEKGLQASAMGATGIAAAAIVTVLMFLLVAIASGVRDDKSTGDQALKVSEGAAYVAAMLLLVRPALARLIGPSLRDRGLTMDTFAVVLITVFLSAYVATKLDLNVIVGGFLAGTAMPERQALFRAMSARLTDLTSTILLPIFLAFSGLLTDFTKLRPEHFGGILLFLVVGIVAKWGGGAVAGRVSGLSWPEANVLGILMNCRGLLVLVVGLIAFPSVFTAPLQVGGVLMALITTMMTGPLFDAFYRAPAPAVAAEAPQPG
jgi:Kef-type K+ transport system membrane component KefB